MIIGLRSAIVVLKKSSVNIGAPLVNKTTNYPLEIVCLDYLSLESSKGGIINISVITDHFTKFAMAIPTKNQTAITTTETFHNNFILHYDIPAKIYTDQGANFENQLIKELGDTLGIEKSRTSAYHPMSNGITERLNRTLINMISTLENLVWFNPLEFFFGSEGHVALDINPGPVYDTLLLKMIPRDLLSACPHRQFHTLPGL